MAKKKRTWKFWVFRPLLILLLLGIGWAVNLIWFKPFSIKHFYDKVFVEFALEDQKWSLNWVYRFYMAGQKMSLPMHPMPSNGKFLMR